MKVASIIQARISSRRLPGKVLMDLGGKPMLQYLIERVKKCREIDELVIATSDGADDDVIAQCCGKLGVKVFRGPLEDVAWRIVKAAESVNCDVIVRLSGDSPFLDQATIDEGIRIFKNSNIDLLTNVKPRTFPPGCSVEIVKLDVLKAACESMPEPEREHVIQYLYSLAHLAIRNFSSPIDLSDYRLTVDNPMEFEVAQRIIGKMDRPHWEYSIQEIVDLGKRIGALKVGTIS